jgi:multidrug efflux pump subunit AcrB
VLQSNPKARRVFFGVMLVLFAGAASLVAFQVVTVKMLPFDNKSEFEVVLDMPPGTPLERTLAVAQRLSAAVAREPEVEQQTLYVGLGSPVTFNGLVRHYDFRTEPRFATYSDLARRASASGRAMRSQTVRPEASASRRARARVKVVEVPRTAGAVDPGGRSLRPRPRGPAPIRA